MSGISRGGTTQHSSTAGPDPNMAAFSEEIVQRRLQELNNTKQSIQTLSLWLLHHRKHAQEIVQLWYRQVKHERRSDRLIVLFYLANDVIQNSRRKYPAIAGSFKNFVQRAVVHARQHMDAQSMAALRRIIEVWEQRSVYSRDFLYLLRSELNVVPGGEAPAGSSGSRASGVQKPRPADEIQSPSDVGASEQAMVRGQKLHAESLPSSSAHVGLPADINKLNEMLVTPPTPSELLHSLQQLSNAASADVAVREKIAKFPPDVADVSVVKRLSTKQEFENFSKLVHDADQVLSEYNSRLAEEMVDRKRVLQKLDAFISEQKKKMDKDAGALVEWKKKLELLNQERMELLKHIESLPDLSRLPDVNNLPPLPSPDELFNP